MLDNPFLVSVNDKKKPITPVNISGIINPINVKTKTSSLVTGNNVVKIIMDVNSLVPSPPNVIGR